MSVYTAKDASIMGRYNKVQLSLLFPFEKVFTLMKNASILKISALVMEIWLMKNASIFKISAASDGNMASALINLLLMRRLHDMGCCDSISIQVTGGGQSSRVLAHS